MITIELTRQTDLSQPLLMETLRQSLYCGDSEAHCVQVHLVRSGEAVDVSGCGAAGYFLRADGATVVIPGQVTDALAQELLSGLWEQELIDRVCFLVAHHHTYSDVDGPDWQILLEADFLVNADEGKASAEAIARMRETVFKTAAGIRLLDCMYQKMA